MAKIGKNILDNLTTGMYSDSKIIYREYIQNACDQVDKAVKEKLLKKGEEQIDITIDQSNRYICITDNATGVSKNDFIENLGDIANSNKVVGEDKGFRGIGRLCGLAYCKTLKFSTSFASENVTSIMICDAIKMRSMLASSQKYTVDEVWNEIITYQTEPCNAEKHFFTVELIDINKENTDLLDAQKIYTYLSFVAPVPYHNTFWEREKIYKHAKELQYIIDEYQIRINGAPVLKGYTNRLKEQSGDSLKIYDTIEELEFHDFYSAEGNLLAWLWVGITHFEKQIPRVNQMRGIRLRSANIQLGEDDVLSELFKESRGNYYFVGEVFAVHKQLIPNSQRNYFNENEIRVEFENSLRHYFYTVLHKLYYEANRIKNCYKKQEDYVAKVEEYNQKETNHGFVSEAERKTLQYEISKSQKNAVDAMRYLQKVKENASDSLIQSLSEKIGEKYEAEKLQKKLEIASVSKEAGKKKDVYITSTLPKLSRREKETVKKIMAIITEVAPKAIAAQIIDRIKEELK